MATIALPRIRPLVSSLTAERVALLIGLTGFLLGATGSNWDVAWHRAFGRDTFWSPPHLLMYVGTSLVGLCSVVAIAANRAGRRPLARELWIGTLHVERALAAVGFGALTIISAAPIDDLWHRSFGRDVDIWSPPHLIAVGGAIVAYAGLAVAVSFGFAGLSRVVRDVVVAALLGALVGTIVFGMNFYYIFAWSREALIYPVVVAGTIPAALALGTRSIDRPFAAVAVALAYTVINVLTFALLRGLGWPAPAFAPLVVVGALAVDVARARTRRTSAVAVAFVVAFVAAEGVRLLITAPVPSAAVLTDATVGHLATQYWQMAVARPWSGAWPLVAIALGVPLGAISWSAGQAAGALLTRR